MAMKMKMITQLIIGQVLIAAALTFQVETLVADYLPVESAARQVLPGCTFECGNVKIPYPFGIGNPTCFLEPKFKLKCTTDSKLYVGSVQVLNISILESQMDVAFYPSIACADEKTNVPMFDTAWFSISSKKNKFVTVGRDSYGYLHIYDDWLYSTGCLTRIGDREFKTGEDDGTCSGRGCCEVDIPPRVTKISIEATTFPNSTQTLSRCSYSFIVKEDRYSFDPITNLQGLFPFDEKSVPVVLDWTIGNKGCNGVTTICSNNSHCEDKDTSYGYRCRCKEGYEGNPYHPDGCTDIDECMISNPCDSGKHCKNTPGSYGCFCPKWQYKTKEGGCQEILLTVLGVGAAIIFLSTGSFSYLTYQKRKLIKLKDEFFRENGGPELQKKLRQINIKIFTEDQLKKATNNYDDSSFLGRGGFGTVYKGTLEDSIVAIKKPNNVPKKVPKKVDASQIEEFFKEMVVLYQINHRNVVKLLGCCLETEGLLLVYEFVSNGTLSDFIKNSKGKANNETWETRLKIATEVAGALSYLHKDASIPIIHRDIKSVNILLDDNHTAKIADFGASILVPHDQNEVATMVQITFGYLDPEFLQTNKLTDKSDVFSFGVVLAELITGQKALSSDRKEENLAQHFLSCIKNDSIVENFQDGIKNDENEQEIKEVAILASKCLRLKGDKRPSMKEVARELEGLWSRKEKHSCINADLINLEETQYLLVEASSSIYEPGDSSKHVEMVQQIGHDNLKHHALIIFDDGR